MDPETYDRLWDAAYQAWRATAQALTGRKVATPELRFIDGAVFLAPGRSRKRRRCSDPV